MSLLSRVLLQQKSGEYVGMDFKGMDNSERNIKLDQFMCLLLQVHGMKILSLIWELSQLKGGGV